MPPEASYDPLNPFPWYRRMRKERPVMLNKQYMIWNVFRYDDVRTVLSDHRRFSSSFGRSDDPFGRSMISSDPPRHTKLRNLVTKAFTPRQVQNMEPRIREISRELLELARGRDRIDLVEAFSYPLPVTVIAEMLGIPVSDRERFKRWSDSIVTAADNWQGDSQVEMGKYFYDIIEERKRNPGEDLISGLIEAEVDGERLSVNDLLGFCFLLLVAGNETTTNLITNAMISLDENRSQKQLVQEDRRLIPKSLEEALRYRSPVQSMFRTASEDVVIGGQEIEKGQALLAWIGSANRDEDIFDRPDEFILGREPNRHLAFGEGIHFCLGAPLARLEAKVAMECLLEEFSDFTIPEGTVLEPLKSTIVYGVRSLPLDVTR